MKNSNITPSTIVPKELRIEIYKEVLEKIKSGKLSNASDYPYGLCRFLPQTLWGIKLNQSAPNGEIWTILAAQEMFPELGEEIIKLGRNGDYLSPQERLDFLERVSQESLTE